MGKRIGLSKGEITREKILESAQRLFFLNGYYRTSIDDILKDSETKKGNFYFHFRSKESLGYAVLDIYSAHFQENLQSVSASKRSSLQKIFLFFEKTEKNLVHNGCMGGCPFGNFALEMSDIHQGFRKRIDQIFDVWAHQIQAILEEGVKRGEIKKNIDIKALSKFLVAFSEGAMLLAKTKKSTKVYRSCTKALRQMLEYAWIQHSSPT